MRLNRPGRWSGFLLLLVAFAAPLARAANPRWTTGFPFFNLQGYNVVWYTNNPLYFTDPGDLSVYVNHAAADAMVAAAAQVWNVPTSLMNIAQGGTLAEQVSGANVYLGPNGIVFPADVESTNYAAIQIAVIYDRDGSVTDLLLGGGASDPSGCLQHGVTESVDSIVPSGHIEHAVLLLNGLCTGADPAMQLQMQYQLERAFGRILGVGWSQLNDNVFTGVPQPTYQQALHWPIMHPIDVICGPYTFQCLPEPFTLRDDDIGSISTLYPVPQNAVPPGKQATLAHAASTQGNPRFPLLEGMSGVNVVVTRNNVPWQVLDNYQDVSTLSGDYGEQFHGNPITPKPSGLAGSFGYVTPLYDVAGYFNVGYIPIPANDSSVDLLISTEPLNPLYIGEYGIGSYPLSTVTPSGDTTYWRFNTIGPFWSFYWEQPVPHIASGTATTPGTESSPGPVPPTGWWNDVLCGPNQAWTFAHTSWIALPVRANRSLTVEMTALNEAGAATGNKVRPVLGLWHASDPTGTPPSIASAPVAFNGSVLGMTSLTSPTTTAADTFRLALSSQTGDGRPDYSYQARVLYADSVSPVSGTAGTPIILTGMGFRTGNTVTVNGVTASVASWGPTSILATVPFLPSVQPSTTVPVNIVVTDLSTGGSTSMTAGLQYVYSAPTYILQLASAPVGNQIVTLPATPAFGVKVLNSDGITPLANAPVVFSATTGGVTFSACGSATCTVLTDATGLASATVVPLLPGAVTLQAASQGQTLQASFQAVALARTASVSPSTRFLAAGAVASWTATALFEQQGIPAIQTPVVWTPSTTGMTLSAAATATGTNGIATAIVQVGPLSANAQATGTVCAWSSICAPFTAIGVDPTQWTLLVTAGGAQNVSSSAAFTPVTLQIVDGSGNPVAGASVQIFQTVRQWTPPCPVHGRCPIAPAVQTSQALAVSDINGNLSVNPLDSGLPQTIQIVATTGTQGYAALTLQRNP